ncbi:carbohydrate ABC transporter permease [Paenibacillus senegalensis]|uniref:carbohydrate ABC transporter permease n=1 Tax=Paenibacillus senegalensis TaxID=1465766 RepID=UPI000289B6C4|nr:sugar ABC transporter permease [Paenibacillus senegalensis]
MSLLKQIYSSRWAYFFILPAYAFFTVFTLYPLAKGLGYSFYNVGLNNRDWVGLGNFVQMASNEVFWTALTNTLLIVLGVVPAVIILSIFISVLVYPLRRGAQTFFRVSFYLPVVASGVVLSMVWQWMLNPSFGLINYVLGWFGVQPVAWLGTPGLAMLSIMVVVITFVLGQPVILYLAALGGIPSDLHEAAMIDGANSWRRFFHITLPLLRPTTLFIAVTQTIGVFQVFVVILLLTNGGPANGTQTLVYRMYQTAFEFYQFGYASALGVVVIIIVTIITLILYRLLGRETEY